MGEMVFMSGLPALLGQLCPFLWRREPHPGTKPHCQCGCGSGSLGGVRLDDAAIDRRHYRRNPHRSEEHTSELQSRLHLVCRLLLEKKKKITITQHTSTHKLY